MEERTGIFQWNVKWHGKALTSVPSAALTSGLLITLTTRLLEINPAALRILKCLAALL